MPSISLFVTSTPTLLSEDVERESQKVRSMYESGTDYSWPEGDESIIDGWIKVAGRPEDDAQKT